MDYRDMMDALSQCGLGALVLSSEGKILSINEDGLRLLHGNSRTVGKKLADIAPELAVEPRVPLYANPSFGEYLVRSPAPEVEGLPPGARFLVFRVATNDACHDMLISILNQLKEAVVLCDADSRIYLLNDAAVRLDSMTTQDVLGEPVQNAYVMEGEMSIPKAIREKKPARNHRHEYMSRYGKKASTVASTFPIVQNGQILGAFNVLEDWNDMDSLHQQILDLQGKLLRQENGKVKKSALSAQYTFENIIHNSPGMKDVIGQCRQVARSDSSVMIYGETGTGKELFAQSIHNASRRANGPFLAINCAALPENLLEGLLFGTEKGAFTHAESRAGLFEQANHGTLLLDEINSMDVVLQAKLLRVLQEGTVRRVGGSGEIRVDVRVLSNINIPPQQAIDEHKLRMDLFYRLGVVNIDIPPLRERKQDIPLLAKHFIMRYNEKLERNVRNVDEETLEVFHRYSWPGNVRELQHAIEHAMNILPDDHSIIGLQYFPKHFSTLEASKAASRSPDVLRPDESLSNRIQNIERENVCKALRQSGGNITKAAKMLKMTRQNLQYRIKRYQIDVQELLGSL